MPTALRRSCQRRIRRRTRGSLHNGPGWPGVPGVSMRFMAKDYDKS